MAIRWDEFPHDELRLEIYSKLARNAVRRSQEDSLRHILQRKLQLGLAEDHRRFIELEASGLVEQLRCTRDTYQEFVNKHDCRPVLEAHWVVLRCAVFPTALALLRQRVIEYARLTRAPGRDLSILYGIVTRTCQRDTGNELGLPSPPDLDDKTPATDQELESLGQLVDEDSVLHFTDIRDDGSVFQLSGGGPFATDDRRSLDDSWALCGLPQQITFINWMKLRERWWRRCIPWSDGLVVLFACVQDELLSQWRALPADSLAHKLALEKLNKIAVPAPLPLRLQRGKECEELAEEIKTIKHKRNRSGLTVEEIRRDCPFFRIWKLTDEVLSADDKDTFLHPGIWERGYENLILGKLYATGQRPVAAGTINTWRKEYRAFLRWQEKNPSKTAEEFAREIQQCKRSYRGSTSAMTP